MRPILLLPLLFFVVLVSPAMAAGTLLDHLPDRSEHLPGYRSDSVCARLAATPLHVVEGLWEMAGDGTLVAIERCGGRGETSTLYRIVAVEATDRAIREGTVMGYLTPSARRGEYDGSLYSSHTDEGTALKGATRYVMTLDKDNSRISLKPRGSKWKVAWWRILLPYMFRHVLTQKQTLGVTPGFVKVFPAPSIPLNPRYL